jgi:restriction endonuclease S subunit
MKTVLLKSIADVIAGYPSKEKINHASFGSHLIIQGKNFNNFGDLNWDNMIRFDPQGASGKYIIQKEDVLLMGRGSSHSAYFIPLVKNIALASSSFYIIRIRDKRFLPEYISWWINKTEPQKYFERNAGATLISYISKGVVECLKIPVVSLDKQEKIVCIQNLLKKERQLTDKLGEKRKQLIKLVCVRSIRFGEEK